jgi:hypothetical protein
VGSQTFHHPQHFRHRKLSFTPPKKTCHPERSRRACPELSKGPAFAVAVPHRQIGLINAKEIAEPQPFVYHLLR